MTTTTRNEAADLLMEQVVAQIESAFPKYDRRSLALRDRVREAIGSSLDEALAESRKATVERISDQWGELTALIAAGEITERRAIQRLNAILDEEAAR